MSHAQYPKVFQQYQEFYKEFDDVSVLDTRTFLEGLKLGELVVVVMSGGSKRKEGWRGGRKM